MACPDARCQCPQSGGAVAFRRGKLGLQSLGLSSLGLLSLGLLTWAVTGPAAAQPVVPLTPQFQVNEATYSFQNAPQVEHLPSGEFLVVWHDMGAEPVDAIKYQRLAPDGTPIGGEQSLNPDWPRFVERPRLAIDRAGGFVAAWADPDLTATGRPMFARQFDSQFQPRGPAFEVAPTPDYDAVRDFDVAFTPSGEFVVVWSRVEDYGQFGETGYDIFLQRYASDGSVLDDIVQVNGYTSGSQIGPKLQVQPDGGFVVVWSSEGSYGDDTSSSSIQMRQVDAMGVPQGPEIQVNSATTAGQYSPAIGGFADGSFLVVWTDRSNALANADIRGQRFDAAVQHTGPEFLVSPSSPDAQSGSAIAASEHGEHVVTWFNRNPYRIDAQAYGADGQALGDPFTVDTLDVGGLLTLDPAIALDEDASRLMFVWSSRGSVGDDNDGFSIQGRLFALPALFRDGFESGDVSAWSGSSRRELAGAEN